MKIDDDKKTGSLDVGQTCFSIRMWKCGHDGTEALVKEDMM